MTQPILARRSFLTGLGVALITAPAIVRVGSIMPVKVYPTCGFYEGGHLYVEGMSEFDRLNTMWNTTHAQRIENILRWRSVLCKNPKNLDKMFIGKVGP
jgi:hypothetical protein